MSSQDDNMDKNRNLQWQLDDSLCLSLELGSETSGVDSLSNRNALSYSLSPLSVATQESGNGSKERSSEPPLEREVTNPIDNVDLPIMTFLDAAFHDPNHASIPNMEEFLENQQQFLSPISMTRESFDNTHWSQVKAPPLTRLWSEDNDVEKKETSTRQECSIKSQESWRLQEQVDLEKVRVCQFSDHNHSESQIISTNTLISSPGQSGVVGSTPDECEVVNIFVPSRHVPADKEQRQHLEQEKGQQQISSSHGTGFQSKKQATKMNEIVATSDPTKSFEFENLQHSQDCMEGTGNEQIVEDRDQDQKTNIKSKHEQANEQGPVKNIHKVYYSSDLASAKKHIDASSLMFIETLRGAARRRKQEVTRSRDSLAAKEKEQLLSIAESKERQRQALAKVDETQALQKIAATKQDSIMRPIGYKPFKARPMIQSGSGGQVGIPKVEKKPTTIPFSPQLGAKRQQRLRVLALEKGQGGQFGVPKVEKKKSTVPVSPHLGLRRQTSPLFSQPFQMSSKNVLTIEKQQKLLQPTGKLIYGVLNATKNAYMIKRPTKQKSDANRIRQFSDRSVSNLNTSICSPGSNSDLCGLRILSHRSSLTNTIHIRQVNVCENTPPTNVTTPRNAKISTFSLHSTERAKVRAEFDDRRLEIQSRKLAVTKEARTNLLIAKRKEVSALRESLRQIP